jgi:UDP-glucose 4-epimerase
MNFSDKKFLITGGTGSFGSTVCKYLLNKDVKEIRIFSRDENKQDKMRREINDERVSFFIGDIRDYDAVSDSCNQIDYVFHAAALKQVPSCEFYPLESIKTNVIGTDNLLRASKINDIKKVVLLSTDKAVYPINAMGLS